MMNSEENKEKGIQKKTLIIAASILLGFFLVGKVLSMISSNPAQLSYESHCASCHGDDGEGLKDLIPPLAKSDWLAENQDRLVCVIKHGINEEITVNGKKYSQQMDGKNLSDIQIYNIINYINTSWGNDFELISTDKVLEEFKKCDKD